MKSAIAFRSNPARSIGLIIALIVLLLSVRYFFSSTDNSVPDAPAAAPIAPASLPTAANPARLAGPASQAASAKSTEAFADTLCQDAIAPLKGDLQQQLQTSQAKASAIASGLVEQALSSPDLLQRAAALLMQAEINTRKIPQQFKDKYPNCSSNPGCLQQMEAATTAERTKNFNEIAKMAIGSRDPQLYATALQVCNSLDYAAQRLKSSEGFCQQISASQWALRDPENGFAWLYAAQQSDIKSSDLDAALLHLTQVRFFNQRLVGLPQLRESFKLAQQDGLVQLELGTLNNGVFRLRTAPSYKILLDYCQAENLRDNGSRRQVCEGIAQKLLLDDTNAGSAPIAASIGSQLGWPTEKLDKITLEQHAYIGLFMTKAAAGEGLNGRNPNQALQHCQDTMKEAKSTFNAMQNGELAGLRQRLAGQSLSKAELAAKFREQFLKDQPRDGAGEKK
ncbi:MAG: hypothetical protein RL748_1607 [Pseudomonadota bacterium]|jgi:hypothetical protein